MIGLQKAKEDNMLTVRFSKALIATGAVFLIIAGMIHLYFGYPSISNDLTNMGAPLLVARLIQAVWIIFSSHLFLISVLLLVGLSRNTPFPMFIVILCGFIPILDGGILTYFAGAWNLGWAVPGVFIVLGGFLSVRADQGRRVTASNLY
jgi:hypothetical protein